VSVTISVEILTLVIIAIFSRATISVSGAGTAPSTFSLLSAVGAVVGRLLKVLLRSGRSTFVAILLVHAAPRVGITAPALGARLGILFLLVFFVPVSQKMMSVGIGWLMKFTLARRRVTFWAPNDALVLSRLSAYCWILTCLCFCAPLAEPLI
jgi:hypothetical protein